MTRTHALAMIAGKSILGATLTLALGSIVAAGLLFSPAHTPEEDEPGWELRHDGQSNMRE